MILTLLLTLPSCRLLQNLLLTILILLRVCSALIGVLLGPVLRGKCGRTLVLMCMGVGIVVGLLVYE